MQHQNGFKWRKLPDVSIEDNKYMYNKISNFSSPFLFSLFNFFPTKRAKEIKSCKRVYVSKASHPGALNPRGFYLIVLLRCA